MRVLSVARGVLVVSVAASLVGCGGSHSSTPVDPDLPEVRASEVCVEMESYSDILQEKQAACAPALDEPIPPFKNSFTCWSAPESWGQRCEGETEAREVFRLCVNGLPYCFPDGSYEKDWGYQSRLCVVRMRQSLKNPDCDPFPSVQQ